ncbi:uncharacterized protein LOC128368360 [Scomber japonicus]|uniref:uncharacterized protein LOC128368360 n=1 Tax=Scomber japonicus TaxID=13676 RepID=UPI00230571B6|nr:uncharacterized protein LOC128368360 [Scomber japonicus]
MNLLTFLLINGPAVILNIVANAFYIFCMVSPRCSSDRIKQPLKILLGSLICCTITCLVFFTVMFLFQLLGESYMFIRTLNLVSLFCLCSSMTSSVWLNFFYCTQIVPAKRALSIWIKNNIKPIIYSIWVIERIYNLLGFTVMSLELVYFDEFEFSHNSTVDYVYSVYLADIFFDVYIIMISLEKAHFLFCLCVMVMSSGSTVAYLCRHMRRMTANGQAFFSSRFRGQVRVTITGILQGILFMICAAWASYTYLAHMVLETNFKQDIYITVANLYMLGTTFNLGAGQAVFRQKAADIWLRATKVQQSEQGG